MDVKKVNYIVGSILWTCCLCVQAEIHRVKPHSMRSSPQNHPHSHSSSDPLDGLIHSKNSSSTDYTRGDACFYSIITSLIVSLSGIFPLLILRFEAGPTLREEENARKLRLFLSFAVGSLLGDVFLHLLPESWKHIDSGHQGQMFVGLWVLTGIFSFIILEKILPNLNILYYTIFPKKKLCELQPSPSTEQNCVKSNGFVKDHLNGCTNGLSFKQNTTKNGFKKYSAENTLQPKEPLNSPRITPVTSTFSCSEVTGYLNLLANCIDNFTHGLAVAASFLVSFKVGALTTFAILIHEIPHEIGDFAILLKSGFSKLSAAKAQLITASGGLLGAIVALLADSPEEIGIRTAWILPFTAGGFINIALVSVLPDLLKESDPKESGKQLLCMLAGITVMALVTKVCD